MINRKCQVCFWDLQCSWQYLGEISQCKGRETEKDLIAAGKMPNMQTENCQKIGKSMTLQVIN